MMNQMMAETLTIGTAHKAALPGWPAAGKTGTSQDFRDAWFIGYTAHLVTGVWLGNDDGTPTKHVTGGGLPVEIWSRFMRGAHQGVPVASLPGRPAAASSRDCSATARGRHRPRRCNRLPPRARPRPEPAASTAGCLTVSSAAVSASRRGGSPRVASQSSNVANPIAATPSASGQALARGTIRPPRRTPPPRSAAKIRTATTRRRPARETASSRRRCPAAAPCRGRQDRPPSGSTSDMEDASPSATAATIAKPAGSAGAAAEPEDAVEPEANDQPRGKCRAGHIANRAEREGDAEIKRREAVEILQHEGRPEIQAKRPA